MARRHGWQLPAHTLQVVAITVFFLLTVAYYAFFAPFLGNKLYVYIAIGVYSFLAFSVLVLYIRCTGIDPADPGIFVRADNTRAHKSQNSNYVPENASSIDGGPYISHGSGCCNALGRFLCGFLVIQDCRRDTQQERSGEQVEALFCSLCNAEVHMFSKHCRSCGKCVDRFDHHCRWLNNCVGQKNYISFVCLMAASFFWLIVEFGVGVTVFVRCFTDQKAMEHLITEKLGVGFSRPPFAAVVAVCTTLSFLALIPLGELFFFHIILIRKGITTYEYIVALRAQTEPLGPSADELDQTSQPPSPTSSAVTATSGRSIQYRGASLCTPPNIFMDQKDDVIQHLEPGPLRSTIDPDTVTQKKPPQRQQVRINPWKLAKLDSKEAYNAAARARAVSSVLLQLSSRNNPYKTSSNVSGRSSPTSTHHTGKGKAGSECCSLSSPGFRRDHFNPMYMSSSANESPLNEEESRNAGVAARRNLPSSDESSVVWDPEAGRFVLSSRIPRTDFGGPLSSERLNSINSSGTDGSRRVRENPWAGTDFGGPLSSERLNAITSSGTDGSRRVRENPWAGTEFGGPLSSERLNAGADGSRRVRERLNAITSSGPDGSRRVRENPWAGTEFEGPSERLNAITSSGTDDGSRRVRENPWTGYFQQVRSQRGDQLPVFMPTDSQLRSHLSTRFH